MATKTGVIVISLSSQPPYFSFEDYPTHLLPPFIRITFPDDVALYPENMEWDSIAPWHSGSSHWHPLYFEMLPQYSGSDSIQFMLYLKPDLSTASLYVMNASKIIHDFDDSANVVFQNYRICEDTLVSGWFYRDHHQAGIYTQSTSNRFANILWHGGLAAKMSSPDIELDYLLYLCPTSGRFVLLDTDNTVSVVDFFWYILSCHGHKYYGSSDAARY